MVYMKLKRWSVAATFSFQVLKSPEQIERAVSFQNRRHAHGRFAAVAQAVKRDSAGIDDRQSRQPAQNLLVLAEDEGEQCGLHAVGLAAEPAVAILAAVQVVRRERDEALFARRAAKSR